MIVRKYECPDCGGIFSFSHHPNDEPPPSFCPLCGADVRDDKLQMQISAPHIAKPIGANTDALYRQMEAASEARIDAAAEITGHDRSDFNVLKVTDLKDNLRAGESAANVPVASANTGAFSTPNGGPVSGSYQSGRIEIQNPQIEPHAGLRAMTKVTDFHKAHSAQIVALGRENR